MEEDKEVKKEETCIYSKLFEDYRVNKASVRYSIVFFLRRYSILLILTLARGHYQLQIMGQMLGTMYVIYYIASARPYNISYMNKQELINEITVLLSSYPLLMFTPWVWD